MKIYIIRHGETKANEMGCLQGATDWPLNENGVQLAEITGKAMKGIHIDVCYCSPLIRAKQTAEAFLRESGNGNTEVIFDRRIAEINIGELEMKRMDELDPKDAIAYLKYPLQMTEIPGGETPTEVCRRTQEFLSELAAKKDDRTYLVSTHGCALRAMLNRLYADPSDFWQGCLPPNCSVSLVEVIDGRMSLTDSDRIYYDPKMYTDHYMDSLK